MPAGPIQCTGKDFPTVSSTEGSIAPTFLSTRSKDWKELKKEHSGQEVQMQHISDACNGFLSGHSFHSGLYVEIVLETAEASKGATV